MTAVDPEAREALIELLVSTCAGLMVCSKSGSYRPAAEAIIATLLGGGRRFAPPNAVVVQTEGEEWEEAITRFIEATRLYGPLSIDTWAVSIRDSFREAVSEGLRAAIAPPKQETSDGE